MKKSNLRDGMKVENVISGNIGTVHLRENEHWFSEKHVPIRRRTQGGNLTYPIWAIRNLRIIPEKK